MPLFTARGLGGGAKVGGVQKWGGGPPRHLNLNVGGQGAPDRACPRSQVADREVTARGTHAADHGPLLVGAGVEQGPQDGLQVLGGVVLRVEQQHRQQLRGLHPGPRHPVGDVVADGGQDLGEVSEDQLPAAQPRAALCRSEGGRSRVAETTSTTREEHHAPPSACAAHAGVSP